METADIKSLSTVLGKYIRIVREVTCKVKYISNYQLLAFESNIVIISLPYNITIRAG